MSDDKKYYWLKLDENFFTEDEIKYIETRPNGDKYISFLIKLLLKSLKHGGYIVTNGAIPCDPDYLSALTGTDIDIIKGAIDLFVNLDIMQVVNGNSIYMSCIEGMIGKESDSAKRVRNHRKKLKALQCNSDVTISNTDKEKETEIDKDKDKKKEVKEKPEAKASPIDKDKEKRQALIDFFYRKYEELYNEKLVFDKKAIGCINNLIKHPMSEIEKRSEMLMKKCKDRKDTFHVFTPSIMLLKWNELVRKPSIYGK